MRLQSLMLLAVTFASFSSALPTRIAKRKLVHDEKGNLKLICKFIPTVMNKDQKSKI